MTDCAECGASGDPKLFICNYCENQFCVDHRLPESHDCPSFKIVGTTLGGQGPKTTDRRGTGRKRRERVREKETKKWENKEPDRQPERGSSDPDVSDLPACAECYMMSSDLMETDDGWLCPECRGDEQQDRLETDSTVKKTDEGGLLPLAATLLVLLGLILGGAGLLVLL